MRVKAVAMLAVLLAGPGANDQSARAYYSELYKAGALDRFADEYVCFSDEPMLNTFFLLAESRLMIDLIKADPGFPKLPKGVQAYLEKGYLIARGYDKGVALSCETFFEKDGSTWSTEAFYAPDGKTRLRVRLGVTWETLRYKRSVEIKDRQSGSGKMLLLVMVVARRFLPL
jgi:hypothetical protein